MSLTANGIKTGTAFSKITKGETLKKLIFCFFLILLHPITSLGSEEDFSIDYQYSTRSSEYCQIYLDFARNALSAIGVPLSHALCEGRILKIKTYNFNIGDLKRGEKFLFLEKPGDSYTYWHGYYITNSINIVKNILNKTKLPLKFYNKARSNCFYGPWYEYDGDNLYCPLFISL